MSQQTETINRSMPHMPSLQLGVQQKCRHFHDRKGVGAIKYKKTVHESPEFQTKTH